MLANTDSTLTNCTVTRNSADYGGGIYADRDVEIDNCIIWRNTATTSGDEIYGTSSNCTIDISYSDIKGGWDGSRVVLADGASIISDGGNIDVNPYFIDPTDPAGPDGIYRTSDDGLRLISFDPRDGDLTKTVEASCIDSADSGAAPETDITGRTRAGVVYILNAGEGSLDYVDMGAYESLTVWYVVSPSSDNGKGKGWSWNFAFDDLQEAIQEASAGDEIWVAKGTYCPGGNQMDTFHLNKAIAIYGGFSGD